MAFVTNNDQAIRNLIETDLNLCVYLLKMAEASQGVFQGIIADKTRSIDLLQGESSVGFKIARTFSMES